MKKYKSGRKGPFQGLLLIILFLFANDVAAQNIGPSISIVPHTFDLSVVPGEKVKKKIKIYNQGKVAIPFNLRMIEFDAQETTGDMELIEAEGGKSNPGDWIEFEKEEFIIDPGQKENIGFTIDVPNDVEEQGYYGVALFEADISTLVFNQSRVQVIPKMGVLFMLKVGEEEISDETLKIVEYTVSDEKRMEKIEKVLNFLAQPFFDEKDPLMVAKSGEPTFVVKLKNDSAYHAKISGEVLLSGLGWKVEEELDFPDITVLPGKTREVLVKGITIESEKTGVSKSRTEEEELVAKKIGFGVMEANLKLESEEGVKKQENQWVFVFSWWLVLFGTLFLIVLFLLKKVVFRKKAFLKKREKVSQRVFEEVFVKKGLKKMSKKMVEEKEKKTS